MERVRRCAQRTGVRGHLAGAEAWLGELVRRDFYHQLLVHVPRIVAEPFVEAAKAMGYRDDARAWNAWTTGATGCA
jgi:deoxyribodipyrimidine photo-lyase